MVQGPGADGACGHDTITEQFGGAEKSGFFCIHEPRLSLAGNIAVCVFDNTLSLTKVQSLNWHCPSGTLP